VWASEPDAELRSINWDDPWKAHGRERTVKTFAAAEGRLAFRGLYPRTLKPCEIEAGRFLGMRFQHPELGIFAVREKPLRRGMAPEWIEQGYRDLMRDCPDTPSCSARISPVRLADGHTGFLVQGKKSWQISNHAVWFVHHERRIEVFVQGPPETFSGEDAIAVANDLVAGP
jgi:hypothetical protein